LRSNVGLALLRAFVSQSVKEWSSKMSDDFDYELMLIAWGTDGGPCPAQDFGDEGPASTSPSTAPSPSPSPIVNEDSQPDNPKDTSDQ
jgi:hypothetical protein